MEQDWSFLLPVAMGEGNLNTSSICCSSTHQWQDQQHGPRLQPQEIGSTGRPTLSSQGLGVRKPPAKPWRKTAADPPVRPMVYRVEPRGFRQLVQQLTGAGAPPQQHPTPPPPPPPSAPAGRFRDAAPAPLEVGRGRPPAQQQQQMVVASHDDQLQPAEQYISSWLSTSPLSGGGQQSPSLLSAYLAWASRPVPSPGAMAPLEQGAAL